MNILKVEEAKKQLQLAIQEILRDIFVLDLYLKNPASAGLLCQLYWSFVTFCAELCLVSNAFFGVNLGKYWTCSTPVIDYS